ncbi:sugar phosphate isomerase/epimerase family protein [Subtercola frigoramans]|uniref:Sugar phosphate isomerase/epimerase n=1 Tax=Subtercola frigoramans TaxID=120298 RepID=A0ABS2L080_9MICO|nr:sugar phosphate isomerase/epimerase [Subtercola frigoramans]MBM7470490.1 sugar phosphate isomerase/epimerase [Subtercola frigoramans]
MISIQLWTLRAEIAERGLGGVVDELASVGFAHVEPFQIATCAAELAPALVRNGMTAPTVHGDLLGDALAASLDAAAAVGAGLLMHPAFLADYWNTPDGTERVSDVLNRAAEAAIPYGIRVAFHNHDDELKSMVDGRPALVSLMDLLSPTAGVEFDPYWTTIAGADVLDTIDALGEHLFALHLKDGPLVGRNEDQVAVGDGEIDLAAVLAAVDSSVPRVISLDLIQTDPFTAVVRSKNWLDRAEA